MMVNELKVIWGQIEQLAGRYRPLFGGDPVAQDLAIALVDLRARIEAIEHRLDGEDTYRREQAERL